ncbi:MAG: ABC transporter ATP-binding protein [Candidimonas sp.]|nr:MAG: ABC transporter ATP-binding protein [Candidimonas sp.]
MASVLRLEGLRYAYGQSTQPVFSDLNLSVDAGEFIAVVGGSGVGKSTLLRCVAGLIPPSSGRIKLNIKQGVANRRTAFVFQDARLLPWRRLRNNVAYGLRGLKLTPAERDVRIDEVLGLTLIDDLARRWPYQLSGGQMQRAGIARALAVHPQLLLMDEPFSAVDALTRQKLQDELLSIWQRTHNAVMFVTHDIEEAVYLADRVIVLADRPARIQLDQRVDLPRPRQRDSTALQQLAHFVAQKL